MPQDMTYSSNIIPVLVGKKKKHKWNTRGNKTVGKKIATIVV